MVDHILKISKPGVFDIRSVNWNTAIILVMKKSKINESKTLSKYLLKIGLYGIFNKNGVLCRQLSVKRRVSSERKISQKRKKPKIFVPSSQAFSQNFAFIRENELSEKMRNFAIILFATIVFAKFCGKQFHENHICNN